MTSKDLNKKLQIETDEHFESNKDTIGVALLVSNDYKAGPDPLPGTHKDAEKLQELFNGFTYFVLRRENVTATEFITCYKFLAEYDGYPHNCKRILVYFSGHGDDGFLIMQDECEVKVSDIVSYFKKSYANNASLATMAKMFFFDACRGSYKDKGYKLTKEKVVALCDAMQIKCLGRVPKEGNTLIAYASTQHFVAYADDTDNSIAGGGEAGSWWTRCLIEALNKSTERDDVCRILTQANILMRKMGENESFFQTAEFISNLADFVQFKQEGIKM